MTTRKQRAQIVESLRSSPEARAEYVVAHIEDGVPFQIRANRVARKLSQDNLGKLCEMKQTALSRLEGDSGGLPNIDTLLRLAAAFDCALIVKFAPFSELLDWADGLGERSIAAPPFDQDKGLCPKSAFSRASTATPPTA